MIRLPAHKDRYRRRLFFVLLLGNFDERWEENVVNFLLDQVGHVPIDKFNWVACLGAEQFQRFLNNRLIGNIGVDHAIA